MHFTVEEMLAAARAEAGIDLFDADAVEPLTVLLDAYNRQAQLHEAGVARTREMMLRKLSNRLRMQRDFLAHPEIADEPLTAPVFVWGLGRSGTTETQKVLAATGAFNWLPLWQVLYPSLITGDRSESPQTRMDGADHFVRWFDAASPQTKFGHDYQTHEPEEESQILDQSLRALGVMGWGPVPAYLDWLLMQDMGAQFRHLRDVLKYLQWQGLADRSRPWLLKSPIYPGFEAAMLEVFPDARMIMPHRHPLRTMPSGIKLMEAFYQPFTTARLDIDYYLAGQVAQIGAHLDWREANPRWPILDVPFSQVSGPPVAYATHVFDHCGIDMTAAIRARLEAWYAARRRTGRHAYALADYGLTEERITGDFARYLSFLDARLGLDAV